MVFRRKLSFSYHDNNNPFHKNARTCPLTHHSVMDGRHPFVLLHSLLLLRVFVAVVVTIPLLVVVSTTVVPLVCKLDRTFVERAVEPEKGGGRTPIGHSTRHAGLDESGPGSTNAS